MSVSVGVVVCAYTDERWEDLRRAYHALLSQLTPPDEIIVVVDHNDRLLDRARASFEAATVIPNAGARGLSSARNTGIKSARADLLLFLDDDAEPEPDWVATLASALAEPNVIGAGGWATPSWERSRPQWFPDCFLWVVGCSYDGLPGAGQAIRNPIGCAMGFHREALERVNGFSSGIGRVGRHPVGCEETELSIRLRQAAPEARIVHASQAVVHHRVGRDRATVSYFVRRCFWEGWSKAIVASSVGAQDALSSERSYTRRVLPSAVASGLRRAAGGQLSGALQAMMVVIGFLATAMGYRRGATAVRRRNVTGAKSRTVPGNHHPVLILAVDEGRGYPELHARGPDGERWSGAWLLLRRRSRVRAIVEIDLTEREVVPAEEIEPRVLAAIGAFPEPGGGPDGVAGAVPDDALPRISVVVPTIVQRLPELRGCVEALDGLDYPGYEVLLVDNRPRVPAPDPLPGIVTGLHRVRVIRAPQPGISAARNAGLEAATGEVIAFTDDDVRVDPGWLRSLGARFALHPDEDVVTGLILPQELRTLAQLWFERHYGGFGSARELTSISYRSAAETTRSRAGRFRVEARDDTGRLLRTFSLYGAGACGAGANMAFRRSALRRLGGFDPALGTGTPARGGEDLAALISVLWSGGRIGYEPAAVVFHTHREEERDLRRQLFSYGLGFTAMLSSLVRTEPRHLWGIAAALPAVANGVPGRIAHAPSDSFEQAGTSGRFPQPGGEPVGPAPPPSLRWLERAGYLRGPWAYWRSTRRLRRQRRGG